MSAMRPSLARSMSSSVKTPTTPRSILKRAPPPPLALTPGPTASFNITVIHSSSSSPSQKLSSATPRSAHVHFPPSASLTATFAVHSPNSYDRGAIRVSPNPLEIPNWGDRIWSPSLGEFKPPQSPARLKSLNLNDDLGMRKSPLSSPVISSMNMGGEDVAASVEIQIPPKAKTRAGAKFRERVTSQLAQQPATKDLGKSLLQYPRSPYPSATTFSEREKEVEERIVPEGVQRTTTVYGHSPAKVSKRARPPALLPSPAHNDLSEAFWKSFSITEEDDEDPRLLFAREDGEIWEEDEGVEGMYSPRPGPARSSLMSPTPSDARSMFPSFGAVLSLGEVIRKPEPVALEG